MRDKYSYKSFQYSVQEFIVYVTKIWKLEIVAYRRNIGISAKLLHLLRYLDPPDSLHGTLSLWHAMTVTLYRPNYLPIRIRAGTAILSWLMRQQQLVNKQATHLPPPRPGPDKRG
jgi:hypothetical protein